MSRSFDYVMASSCACHLCWTIVNILCSQVRVNKASAHQKNLDVGANIFIGNLDPEVLFFSIIVSSILIKFTSG